MKPSDFYTMASKLVKYSQVVQEIITSSNGMFADDPDPILSPKNDRPRYWDDFSDDITFGRYLLFSNSKVKDIKFWAGFSSTQTEIIYCIWFKKSDIQQYITKLENAFYHRCSGTELWIPMRTIELENLCNGCNYCIKQTVTDFWNKVLGAL